jgi:DNA-binding PadR family transcriptional regulator
MPSVFAHGQLRLYLLALLEAGPRHGYELITALSDRFGGTYRPSAGTVYPRLARLEEEGLVASADSEDGRKTTYRLTEAGRRELDARRADLAAVEADIAATVRERAGAVREDVREAMSRLRDELAGAAERARASATHVETPLRDARAASHARRMDADAAVRRFTDELRADLRRADAVGEVTDLTVATVRTVLASALSAVRGTLRG